MIKAHNKQVLRNREQGHLLRVLCYRSGNYFARRFRDRGGRRWRRLASRATHNARSPEFKASLRQREAPASQRDPTDAASIMKIRFPRQSSPGEQNRARSVDSHTIRPRRGRLLPVRFEEKKTRASLCAAVSPIVCVYTNTLLVVGVMRLKERGPHLLISHAAGVTACRYQRSAFNE